MDKTEEQQEEINELTELSNSITNLSEKINLLSNEHTLIINEKNLIVSNSYTILKANGHGKVKEVIIVINVKPDIYIKSDGKELYNINADFDNLSSISEYSNYISSITSATGNKYIIVAKDIKFTKNILITISFSGNANISNIFCIYDIDNIQGEKVCQ